MPSALPDSASQRHAVEFRSFFATTPQDLLQRGIYNDVAISLKIGAWRTTGVMAIAHALLKPPTPTGVSEHFWSCCWPSAEHPLSQRASKMRVTASALLTWPMRMSLAVGRRGRRMSLAGADEIDGPPQLMMQSLRLGSAGVDRGATASSRA